MIRAALALVALLAQPLAAAAQPPAPTSARIPAPQAGAPWRVDWGRYECALIRKPAAGRPFSAAFLTIPGGSRMMLRLVMEPDNPLIEDVDNVFLLPGGRSFPVTTDRRSQMQRRGTRDHFGLPPEFRQLLADATALELRTGVRPRATVPLDGIRPALAAQQSCITDVGRQWGLDPVALATLSRRPTSTNTAGLRVEDYPTDALRGNAEGRVAMRILVTAEGRAADCVAVASSGRPDFDAAACRAALSRGRFDPGLDAAGRPVAVRDVFIVGFYLPDG